MSDRDSSTAQDTWTFLDNLEIGDLAPIDESVDLVKSEVGFYLVLEGGERIGPYSTARQAVESGTPDPQVVDLTRERNEVVKRAEAADRQRDVLVGWEQAVLSEGQAARLLGIDRLRLRELRDAAAERSGELWEQYRKEHPVELPANR